MHKDRLTIDEQRTQTPDFIPEDQEYLYPHVGSIFCDFVPEGKTAMDVHGRTADAAVIAPGEPETILVPKPVEDNPRKK